MGVEFEGAWKRTKRNKTRLKRDGSVNFYGTVDYLTIRQEKLKIGEIVSKPHSNRGKLKFWMKNLYPKLSNRTCGLHIHVSFKNPRHKELLRFEFNDYFINSLKEWTKDKNISQAFQDRLNGNNNYCKITYDPYNKCQAVNFSRNGTLEFRIFSQVMEVDLAHQCVDFVHDAVENFLDKKLIKA